jgi:LuxR family maltose regulon positive regulatory protein
VGHPIQAGREKIVASPRWGSRVGRALVPKVTNGTPFDLAGIPGSLPHYVSRDRLLRLLDRATSSLVVIRAPGGAGKTSLLVDWLRNSATPRPTVWVGLDDTARSRNGFWNRVVRTLIARKVVKPDGRLFDVLAGYVDVSQAPALLLDELTASRTSLRLILDDLHLADEASVLDVVWLLRHAADLQVIVTTRQRLGLERPEIAARLEPFLVTGKELAFDVHETATVISTAQTSLTGIDAATIHRSTGGHPLATRIAVATFGPKADGVLDLVDHATLVSRVATHAADELLPAFRDGPHRLIALRISVASSVDAELARALTGQDDVQAMLQDFEYHGYGEFQEVNGVPAFEFHSLVRAALEWEADKTLDEAELVGLRRATARHLAATGNPLGAARLFARIGDDHELWQVLARNYSEVMTLHFIELKEVFAAIPQERILAVPTLAITLAILLSEREPVPSAYAKQLVEAALLQLSALDEQHDPAERFWNLLAVFAGLRVVRRYAEDADAGILLRQHLDGMTAAQRAHLGGAVGVALVQMALTNMHLGRFDDALGIFHALANEGSLGRNQYRLSMVAEVQALRGDIREARAALGEMPQDRVETWRSTLPASGSGPVFGWYVAETISRLENNRAADAAELISHLDPHLRGMEQWPYPVWAKGLARLAANDADRGADELLAMVSQNRRHVTSNFAIDMLSALRADLLLATGSRERARRVLSARKTTSIPLSFARSRIALADGRPGETKALLSPILRDEETMPRHLAEALLLHAICDARLGYIEDARLAVLRAFRVLQVHDLRLPLIMVPRAELLQLIDEPAHLVMLDGLADPFAHVLTPVILTAAELTVMRALSSAPTLEVAAVALHLSVNTVRSHLYRIYRKLGVTSREQAIAEARRRGLLDPPT